MFRRFRVPSYFRVDGHANGRPGLMLWRIPMLAMIKQGLDRDYNWLEEPANEHHTLRLILQHVALDPTEYSFRILKNNVDSLTPAVLAQVTDIVVRAGSARVAPSASLATVLAHGIQ